MRHIVGSSASSLLPWWEKVAEGRMRQTITANDGCDPPPPPLRGTYSHQGRRVADAFGESHASRAVQHYWAEGRMRGNPTSVADDDPPHPPLRGTFSHKGRREVCLSIRQRDWGKP